MGHLLWHNHLLKLNRKNKNIARLKVHTIFPWPNPTQWQMGHTYFPFDDDNKIKQKYFHNHHMRNGPAAEYTEPHILHER